MTAVAAVLVVPVAMVSGCSSNQSANNQTTSSSPSAAAAPPGTERLTAQLKKADGTTAANATLDFANGYATVTVETVGAHSLTPGFHGLHIHSVGKCEGDFTSAGGHYQAPGHTGYPASGDLTSLEVRSDGSAKLVTTTNSFTASDLLQGGKTALIIHEGPDNFGNIPPRYTHNGTAGPDQETLSTGDAGKRVACGVVNLAGGTSTTTTATAPATPAGPATGVTTSAPAPQTGMTTTTPTAITGTSTVTETTPSVSTSTSSSPAIPGPPGG